MKPWVLPILQSMPRKWEKGIENSTGQSGQYLNCSFRDGAVFKWLSKVITLLLWLVGVTALVLVLRQPFENRSNNQLNTSCSFLNGNGEIKAERQQDMVDMAWAERHIITWLYCLCALSSSKLKQSMIINIYYYDNIYLILEKRFSSDFDSCGGKREKC